MRNILWPAGILLLTITSFATTGKDKVATDGATSMVIIFKDGHQQTFAMSNVARIDFTTSTVTTGALPSHFLGKWEVGDGMGGTFFITLNRNGDAKKSIGATHGRWTIVQDEARITWDDGWKDAIRKAGDGYEKAAFGPGKDFSDSPSNVENAKNTEPI